MYHDSEIEVERTIEMWLGRHRWDEVGPKEIVHRLLWRLWVSTVVITKGSGDSST